MHGRMDGQQRVHPPCVGVQVANPDWSATHKTRRNRGPSGVPCSVIHSDGVKVFRAEYMGLYELDTGWDIFLGGNGSDWVNYLGFPTITVPITCYSSSYCYGRSLGVPPAFQSNGSATARMAISVYTVWR